MSKKPKEKQPPSPILSSSSSYYEEEEEEEENDDSPPPAISPSKNPPSLSTTKSPQKPPNPPPDSIRSQQDDEELSGSEEDSTEEESSEDFRTEISNQVLNPSPSSNTESESESDQPPPPPPPPPQQSANAESSSVDESEESADASLKPLSSKPMDPNPNSRKRPVTSPAGVSEKRRRVDENQKKEVIRRIWSKADELILLRCFLDCSKKQVGASGQVQVEFLLKSVNDSLSSSVTLTQMNEKIRRLKLKYNTAVKRVGDANSLVTSNAHDAACFDLSRKIWGKEEAFFVENSLKVENVKKNCKEDGEKVNLLVKEYPFLNWLAKNDHADNALVVNSHISDLDAKELEGSCKKLEISEIQLHMKKMNLLALGLKLIEDAIEKL